jgi:DtxR family Mn-dependent transcriptional regulator
MATKRTLSESQEDYLEAIFHIVAEKHAARVKDIAERLGVNPASVTGALGVLSGKGLVNYAPYEAITLTPQGKKVSRDVVRRHEVLHSFFLNILSVDHDIADRAACSMEHALSREILERLTQFLDFVERNPHCLADFRQDTVPQTHEKKKNGKEGKRGNDFLKRAKQ